MQLKIIQRKNFEVRRQKVMLDFDLAELYQVEATSSSTNYIASTHVDTLPQVCVYEYTYNLIIGALPQIRAAVYQLYADTASSVATGITATPLQQISIFPNPAGNIVNISTGSTMQQNVSLQLFNMEGQLLRIAQINTANYEMDIAGLAKGVYVIRLTDKEEVYSRYRCQKWLVKSHQTQLSIEFQARELKSVSIPFFA